MKNLKSILTAIAFVFAFGAAFAFQPKTSTSSSNSFVKYTVTTACDTRIECSDDFSGAACVQGELMKDENDCDVVSPFQFEKI